MSCLPFCCMKRRNGYLFLEDGLFFVSGKQSRVLGSDDAHCHGDEADADIEAAHLDRSRHAD